MVEFKYVVMHSLDHVVWTDSKSRRNQCREDVSKRNLLQAGNDVVPRNGQFPL